MNAKYFALLTNIGVAKIANAAALGIKLKITELAVGDGGGTLPTPTPDQIALINERRRAPINQLSIDPLNDAQIIVEQVIPENVGGWWIKEVGLFDEDGDLIAVSNCPETYKPLLQEGSGRTQIVRMVIIVSNTSSVTVKIDPAVVLATREYVNTEIKKYDEKHRNDLAGSDGLKYIGRCQDIAALRATTPSSLPQRIEVITYRFSSSEWAAQYDPLGGGQFEAVQDSTTQDDGGSFIRVNATWGWKRVFRGFATLHDFGADGTLAHDEAAKNNALAFCGATKLDLQVLPGTYYFSSPVLWRSRNHSITSKGNVVFDFTNCPVGTYAVHVVEQAQNEGTIWHGITHSISGVSLYGKTGVHGVIINQANEYSTPAVNIDNCFFNEFDDNITFGNNEWICVFRRCFFRGNSNGTSRFVVVNKNYNACENQRFESCAFGGNQTALAIKHIAGSCEFTFDGCSFDYNRGVLQSVNPGARGMWRFTNCHFEDSGAVRNFDIDTGSSTSYIDLIGCDWYFTENFPSKIGVFKSTNSASTLNITSCKLTIFQETQDRSVVDLFTSDTSAGSRFKINTDANTIEMSSNNYFNVLCAANNLYARFTEANLTSGQFVFNGEGTTVFSNTDYPLDSTKQTWITTGGREAYAWFAYNPSKRLAVSGWIRKSTDYYVEVRFFNTEDIIIGMQTLGVPGATGVWSKFGQMIYPPAGTAKVRLGWHFPARVTAGDTVSVNNWIVEQY